MDRFKFECVTIKMSVYLHVRHFQSQIAVSVQMQRQIPLSSFKIENGSKLDVLGYGVHGQSILNQ